MSVKVKLYTKAIKGKRKSFYLDFYPPIINSKNGKPTRREFLGLYILDKPKTPIEKQSNKEIEIIALQIKQKRENELNKPEIYTDFEKEQLRMKELNESNFVVYFKELVDKRKGSTSDNWNSSYKYLLKYTNGYLTFANLNEKFCNDFREYLLTTKSNKSDKVTLSQNSAASYFINFKIALKQAFKDGYLQQDLNVKIKQIEVQEVVKQTLTKEEFDLLALSDCRSPLLKKVVIFSVMTGMAFKELQNLVWSEIEVSESFGVRIKMVRQKTKKPFYINISEQAYSLLGESQAPNDKIFEGLNDRDRYYFFPLWLAEVGIRKKMTFHDLRHTYGCMQIDLGTDIYTLQGNMGHATPRQSMMYGKISDNRKRVAAERIQLPKNPTNEI